MLRSIKDITANYQLNALDGEIGKVSDFYFNDTFWIIKYLVADTGDWLRKRLVLLSPVTLGRPDRESSEIDVNLTKEKIEKSPPVEKHKPVSRQREEKLMKYYAWPSDLTYGLGAVNSIEMQLLQARMQKDQKDGKDSYRHERGDAHLRSTNEVIGYDLQTTDGAAGNVYDFIIEDKSWVINYLVVDTGKLLPGRKVLLSPGWIKKTDWAKHQVIVNLNMEAVKNSPEYDPSDPVNRAFEEQEYDYYGRPAG